ncbi:MAG: hypothetical protein MUQ32_11205, partial [Chloroflexi bacterium]|nr:hypothetical protein [Chloroflexota bacterium]
AVAWAFLAAALYAALTVPFVQLHGLLFGAEERVGVSPLAHALGEGITVFQVSLLLVPASLLAVVLWRDSRHQAPDRVATNGAAAPVPSAAPGTSAIPSFAGSPYAGDHR